MRSGGQGSVLHRKKILKSNMGKMQFYNKQENQYCNTGVNSNIGCWFPLNPILVKHDFTICFCKILVSNVGKLLSVLVKLIYDIGMITSNVGNI